MNEICDYNQATLEQIIKAGNLPIFADFSFNPGEIDKKKILGFEIKKTKTKHLVIFRADRLIKTFFNRAVPIRYLTAKSKISDRTLFESEAVHLNYEPVPRQPDWIEQIILVFNQLKYTLPDGFDEFCDVMIHVRSYHAKCKTFQQALQCLMDLSLSGKKITDQQRADLSAKLEVVPDETYEQIFYYFKGSVAYIDIDLLLASAGAKLVIQDASKPAIKQAQLLTYDQNRLRDLIASVPNAEKCHFKSEFELVRNDFVKLWQAQQ